MALRKEGLRGQAFVIYNDVQSATAAIQAEQGFTFFGKDMNIQYANEKSDRIAKRDGSYVPRAKRKKVEKTTEQPPDATAAAAAMEEDQDGAVDPSATAAAAEDSPGQPSHILFAENLPDECNQMMLAMLFRQYAGFKEVRMPRPGLAFVEYEDEAHATLALKGLNGFSLTNSETLKLKYGKA